MKRRLRQRQQLNVHSTEVVALVDKARPKGSGYLPSSLYRHVRSRTGILVLVVSASAAGLVVLLLLSPSLRSLVINANAPHSGDQRVQSDREIILQALRLGSELNDTSEIHRHLKAHTSISTVNVVMPSPSGEVESSLYINYKASQGLGHRLTRAAAAYHLARRLGVGLKQDWGKCPAKDPNVNAQVKIWEHLFGSENESWGADSATNSAHTQTNTQNLTISNEVPGYKPYATRQLRESALARSLLESSIHFYRALRYRFLMSNQEFLHSFIINKDGRRFFDRLNYVVIGIHVRAGNGEMGEFVAKKRNIADMDDWVSRMVPVVLRYINEQLQLSGSSKQPLIYVATDTPRVVDLLQVAFAETKVQVISYPQNLEEKGTGPSYHVKDEHCLEAWELQLIDMVLLSLSDIIVAARYSSFTQTMPLALLFSDRRNNLRKVKGNATYPYCEIQRNGASMACFRSYQGWLARTRKDNPFRISYDSSRVVEWYALSTSAADGHEDALAYPLAEKDCLKQSAEFYVDNRPCLEAHLRCTDGKYVC